MSHRHNVRTLILLERDNRTCWLCGLAVSVRVDPGHPIAPSSDHIVPLSAGGKKSGLDNVRLAHRVCNARRHPKDRDRQYWLKTGAWIKSAFGKELEQAEQDKISGWLNKRDYGRMLGVKTARLKSYKDDLDKLFGGVVKIKYEQPRT